MKRTLRIAIYSGEIPSTTFIERLIRGVSEKNTQIILFGILHKRPNYNERVKLVGYKSNRLSKFWNLVRFTVLLSLFKRGDKKRLDTLLIAQQRIDLYTKVKYYPVLWHKPDILHLQWAKGLKDWHWVQEFGIKLVLSLRGAHINYSPIADEKLATMYRENFPKVDVFHAVSKAIGKEAEKYGAPKDKIKVVYSGLPLETEKITPKTPNKIFQIISIGRPHWKKGYVYALDACEILKEQHFKFHYTIVGGTNEIEFAYQVHDLKLTEEVTLLDKLPYKKVQEFMQNSDLLLLPSVEEGIANVVLEAMLNKTLVLTTDCGGMHEVIQDGINGFMVPIRNSESMAKKIMEIAELQHPKEESILQNALKTINEKHSEEQMVNNMLSLYQSVKNA